MKLVLLSILFFFISLSILVVAHEFGHFWVARRLGIKVLRFSVGFGKALWTWHDKTGTEYVLAALPLGGYVKMLDEREGPVAQKDLPTAFNRQPLLARVAVVCAGPVFNMLLAVIIYWLIHVIGQATPIPIIGTIQPKSIANTANLHIGDEIIAIDGTLTKNWSEVNFSLLQHMGERGKLQITTKERSSNKQTDYILDLNSWPSDNKSINPLENIGLVPYHPPLPATVGAIVPTGPAARAGILVGDTVLAVDGQKVSGWEELVKIIQQGVNKAVNLEILRQNTHLNIVVTPEVREGAANKKVGFLGVQSKPPTWPAELLRKDRFSLWGAWKPALVETWKMTQFSVVMLSKLVTGKIAATNVSGPVGIASTAGLSISLGWTAYLSFLALLSINLAILNILPIPLLDGGHLVYYACEAVTGKSVSIQAQNVGTLIGMILIGGLMLIAFFNDINRLLN